MKNVHYAMIGAFLLCTGFCYAQTGKHPDSLLEKNNTHIDSMPGNMKMMPEQQLNNFDSGLHKTEESVKTGIAAEQREIKNSKPDSFALSMVSDVSFIQDSSGKNKDSIPSAASQLKNEIENYFRFSISKENNKTGNNIKDTSTKKIQHKQILPVMPVFSKPVIATKGRIDYYSFYRSHIDTPFLENNIYQHQVNGTFNVTIGNVLPLRISTLLRRSNSFLYRDLSDVQVEFDVQEFQQKLYKRGSANLHELSAQLKDSMQQKISRFDNLMSGPSFNRFENLFCDQNIVEARELINVPEMTWDKRLPDSTAKIKSDSILENERAFLQAYELYNNKKDSILKLSDSLKNDYKTTLAKYEDIKKVMEGRVSSYAKIKELETKDSIANQQKYLLPQKYRWLLGIRKFSLGRSPVQYSELTAKNMTINGINIEYNSWYYFSLSAGALDYRFRDYIFNSSSAKAKNYFGMIRAGLGNSEKNYIILSFFKGTKQYYIPGNATAASHSSITGISLEAKYKLNALSYIKFEAAQSVSPDVRKTPITNTKWGLSDKTNKAWYVFIKYAFPSIRANFEGYYKNTGSNYQSFNSIQSNQPVKSYSLKWEQSFFRRQLKINASIRKNEFSNPYPIVQYSSNSIFKTVQLIFKKHKWPMVSVAYMPMSQLVIIDSLVYENRFNALNAMMNHFYKVGDITASTSLLLAKFYNKPVDTGYIYYNSKNIFVNQSFNFKLFTSSTNFTYTKNPSYVNIIAGQNIQSAIKKIGTVLLGVKIIRLNNEAVKTGFNASYSMSFQHTWSFNVNYDDSYLPGRNGVLVKNTFANIQLTKIF